MVSQDRCQLALVGSGGVGKSALTLQFTKSMFCEEYDPTIEDSYQHQIVVDNAVAHLEILDTAGQEEYSAIREQYMYSGEGFLLVYSVSDRESFNEMPQFRTQILRVHEVEEFPMILVANKCDISGENRKVSSEEGKALAQKFGCKYIETSAKNKINVDEVFQELVRLVRRKNGIEPSIKPKKSLCSLV